MLARMATPTSLMVSTLLLTTMALVGCGYDDDATASTAPVVSLSPEATERFCGLMEESDDLEPNGSESPEELEPKLAEFRSLLSRIVEQAPSDLADEVEASVSAYSRLIDLTHEAGYDLDALDPDQVGELSAEINANGNIIQNWLDRNCDDGDGG